MLLLKTEAGAVSRYPYSYQRLKLDHPRVSLPITPDPELLANFSVFPVQETSKPEPGWMQRVEEAIPLFLDGQWVQQWNVTDMPVEDIQTYLVQEAILEFEQAQQEGMPWDFGTPYGILTLQTRDEDKANWLAVFSTSSYLAGLGMTEVIGVVRTAENVTIPYTPAQGVGFTLAIQSHMAQLMQQIWARKDAIRAATTRAELAVLEGVEL